MLRRISLVIGLALANASLAQQATDPNLTVQPWVRGLQLPTGAEIANSRGDLFVIEKNTGRVQFVRDRRVRRTLLDLPVANASEQGLLGITLSPTFAQDNYVYLYYTPAASDGGAPIANAIVRYKYDGEQLVFNRKIKTMPATPGPNHAGGRLTFGPDGKLYAAIGDLNRNETTSNYSASPAVTRTGAVLRLEPWGASPTDNPFYNARYVGTRKEAVNDIYAYGVRNSFGIAHDPVTGLLWDSENGPDRYDEINIVRPGFNSGWERIMGPANRNGGVPDSLVSFNANAQYSDPEFSWLSPIAPTDVMFMPSARLGREYRGDLFVGTFDGALMRFDLNADRTGVAASGNLADLVADNTSDNRLLESESLIFANGFAGITDLFAGPGGMFVVSLDGMIYRITTTTDPTFTASRVAADQMALAVPEPAAVGFVLLAGGYWMLRRHRGEDASP